MSDITTYKGKWWLPTNARKKLSGTLEVNSYGKAQIQIDGQFFTSPRREDNFQSIILGRTDKGDVTLYRNYLQGSGGRLGRRNDGYNYSKYEPQYVLTDGHFHDLEVAKFEKTTLSYSNLFNWLNQTGRHLEHTENLLKIDNAASQEFTYKINDDLELQFLTYVQSSGSPLSPINMNIREEAVLVVRFHENKKFEEILTIERHIKNFLRFALTKNTHLSGFHLERPKNRKKGFIPSSKVIQPYKPSVLKEDISWFEMLFNFREQENDIAQILINWFTKYEELAPVYNLYFNAFYSETTILEQSFLNAIQALEAYHRRTYRNNVLPKDEHKQMVNAIVDSTPDEYKNWLKGKLAFSNEPTLHTRINDILADFDEINHVLIADPDFSRTITRYRNLFTHYDPKKTKVDFDSHDLFKQWHKLRLLLDSCILKELGMSTDLITTLIRKKYIRIFNYL